MIRYALTIAACLCAAPLHSQQTAEPPQVPAVIHLPPEVGPSPTPAPVPGGATLLPADTLFVVSSNSDFIVLASPDALVTVTRESGPLSLRAKFVEAPDKVVTRKVADKFIAIVEASGSGRCELIVVPVGVQKTSDIIRRLVDCGAAPQPPTPPPVPPSPLDQFAKDLQAAYAADLAPDKAHSLAFLTAAYAGMSKSPPAGLKTNQDVLTWMKSVVEAPGVGLTATQISGVRNVIKTHLAKTFGTSPTAPANVDAITTEFALIANSLAAGVH